MSDEPQDWRSTAEMVKAGLCPKCGSEMLCQTKTINRPSASVCSNSKCRHTETRCAHEEKVT
jgi:hypothetical protein